MSRESFHKPKTDQYTKVIEQWEAWRQSMLESGNVSVPKALGAMVIIASGADPDSNFSHSELEQNLAQAEYAKQVHEASGDYATVVICPEASLGIFKEAMEDREIAGLHLIGHGSVNHMLVPRDNGGGKRSVTWQDLARLAFDAGHLKREVVQMTCTHFPLDQNVPMGALVVARLKEALFAPGCILPDEIIPNHKLIARSVLKDEQPLIEQLSALNDKHRGEFILLNTAGDVTHIIRQELSVRPHLEGKPE